MLWTPHDYQRRALPFLRDNSAILVIPMGGGKTSTVLTAAVAAMEAGEAENVLIIAPRQVAVDTWPDEISKWNHLTGYSVGVAIGDPIARLRAVRMRADFTLINFDNLPWLANVMALEKIAYDIVIVDEITRFKQPSGTLLRKFMSHIRPRAKLTWGLTASPLTEGDFTDLWGCMYAVDRGVTLGETVTDYRGQYFQPGFRGPWDWKLQKGADARILDRINSRRKLMKIDPTEVAAQLPGLQNLTRKVTLPPDAMRVHDELKEELITRLSNGEILTSPNVATALNRCLQIAGGAIYGEDGVSFTEIHDAKLKALDSILEEHGGENVIIAYTFKHEWRRLRQRVKGVMEARERDALTLWRGRKLARLAIHPASAGEGLNLQTGGRSLVWYSRPWSNRLAKQTLGRIYRQGQTENVLNTAIVAARTVDELVTANHAEKQLTETAFLEGLKAL